MTFTKQNLILTSGSIIYINNGERRVLARFKGAVKSSAGPFRTFLIKNFTVEEYFARIDAGEKPLQIAKSKGFILSHIKRWLKDAGYPVTQEGYARFMADTCGA